MKEYDKYILELKENVLTLTESHSKALKYIIDLYDEVIALKNDLELTQKQLAAHFEHEQHKFVLSNVSTPNDISKVLNGK